ncbi:MAG: protein kinase, partial [Eubacteriales bacterium]|nr:protein kinase [Eubacteriales bacterium]
MTIPWQEWNVEEEIGKGTQSEVYRISREVAGQKLCAAMKVICFPESDEHLKEMLAQGMSAQEIRQQMKIDAESVVQELGVLMGLNHLGNTLVIEDIVCWERTDAPGYQIFLRMSLAKSLTQYLREQQRDLSPKEVIALGCALCDILSEYEKRDLIFGNMKLSNVFVLENGKYALGDFGTAHLIMRKRQNLEGEGVNYMAPETFWDGISDRRSDIYALGILLYRLLNHGKFPFMENKNGEAISEKIQEAFRKRMGAGVELPDPMAADPKLSMIIRKACAPKSALRYQTAAELKYALEEYGQSIQQQETHKTAAGGWKKATAAVLVCIFFGAAFYVGMNFRKKNNEYNMMIASVQSESVKEQATEANNTEEMTTEEQTIEEITEEQSIEEQRAEQSVIEDGRIFPEFRASDYITLGEYKGITVINRDAPISITINDETTSDPEILEYYARRHLINEIVSKIWMQTSAKAIPCELYDFELAQFDRIYGDEFKQFVDVDVYIMDAVLPSDMILLAVAEQEQIMLTEEEYIEGLSLMSKMRLTDEVTLLNEFGESYVRKWILMNKAGDFLYDHANLVSWEEDREKDNAGSQWETELRKTEYYADTTHRYKLFTGNYTWSEANDMAKAIGGYLVEINTEEEYHHLHELYLY